MSWLFTSLLTNLTHGCSHKCHKSFRALLPMLRTKNVIQQSCLPSTQETCQHLKVQISAMANWVAKVQCCIIISLPKLCFCSYFPLTHPYLSFKVGYPFLSQYFNIPLIPQKIPSHWPTFLSLYPTISDITLAHIFRRHLKFKGNPKMPSDVISPKSPEGLAVTGILPFAKIPGRSSTFDARGMTWTWWICTDGFLHGNYRYLNEREKAWYGMERCSTFSSCSGKNLRNVRIGKKPLTMIRLLRMSDYPLVN